MLGAAYFLLVLHSLMTNNGRKMGCVESTLLNVFGGFFAVFEDVPFHAVLTFYSILFHSSEKEFFRPKGVMSERNFGGELGRTDT